MIFILQVKIQWQINRTPNPVMPPPSIPFFLGLRSAVIVIIRLSKVGLTKILENFFRNGADNKNNNKDREMVQMLVKHRVFSIYPADKKTLNRLIA